MLLAEQGESIFALRVNSRQGVSESCTHAIKLSKGRFTLYVRFPFRHGTSTYWLPIRYNFKTSDCQSVFKLITISLANKIVQNYTGLNNVHCKVRTDIKRSLENSPFIAQNSKSTFHVPSCSAQAVVLHSFFNTQIRSTKRSKYISV